MKSEKLRNLLIEASTSNNNFSQGIELSSINSKMIGFLKGGSNSSCVNSNCSNSANSSCQNTSCTTTTNTSCGYSGGSGNKNRNCYQL